MKLATLETAAGARVVGVINDDGNDRYADLAVLDSSLSVDLKQLLSEPAGLSKAATAY